MTTPARSARPYLIRLTLGKLLSGWSLAVFALGLCWLEFFNSLRGEWQVNAQYNYGYAVPLLGAALFWLRWPERPSANPGNPALAAFLAVTSLAALLPLRVILEANPEWRLAFWLQGFLVLALTFSLLYAAGGRRWARFFAPPLFFMLIAVPWPMSLERALIQNLMRLVAGLTVELLGWLGIPALQHGNLIQISTGIVGIDEACSGVRSLQSGLMLSLFLGEMHRFPVWRRIGLVAASFLVVLVANLARTTFLTWIAATHGLHQMEGWHDSAGILVMCIVLPGLVGLAWWMKRKSPAPRRTQSVSSLPAWAIPRWVSVATISWLAFSEVATEIWYRTREHELIRNTHWSVAWPVQNAQFRRTSLPQNSLAILRCSESESGAWEDDEGDQWSGFLLRWRPGRNSSQLAKGHRPEICFPAAGASLVDAGEQVLVEVHGMKLPFRHQVFESGPRLLHVFYCLWPEFVSPREEPLLEDGSQRSRLLAVKAGKRNLGQQVLELVVVGPDTSEAANTIFRRELPHLIQVEAGSEGGKLSNSDLELDMIATSRQRASIR
jgi:exosortase